MGVHKQMGYKIKEKKMRHNRPWDSWALLVAWSEGEMMMCCCWPALESPQGRLHHRWGHHRTHQPAPYTADLPYLTQGRFQQSMEMVSTVNGDTLSSCLANNRRGNCPWLSMCTEADQTTSCLQACSLLCWLQVWPTCLTPATSDCCNVGNKLHGVHNVKPTHANLFSPNLSCCTVRHGNWLEGKTLKSKGVRFQTIPMPDCEIKLYIMLNLSSWSFSVSKRSMDCVNLAVQEAKNFHLGFPLLTTYWSHWNVNKAYPSSTWHPNHWQQVCGQTGVRMHPVTSDSQQASAALTSSHQCCCNSNRLWPKNIGHQQYCQNSQTLTPHHQQPAVLLKQ